MPRVISRQPQIPPRVPTTAVVRAPLLPHEESVRLFERMHACRSRAVGRGMKKWQQQADAIRNQLLEANLGLVRSVARACSHSSQQAEDWFAEGYWILFGAIDKFDCQRGFRFSTYATHCLRRHFFRCWMRETRRRERPLWDTVDHPAMHLPAESALSEIDLACGEKILRTWDSCLDQRERTVIAARFGLEGQARPLSLVQVAEQLSLSKERVRQIQLTAIRKLQDFADQLRPRRGRTAQA